MRVQINAIAPGFLKEKKKLSHDIGKIIQQSEMLRVGVQGGSLADMLRSLQGSLDEIVLHDLDRG